MAKMNGQGLEALAVRRTALADSDKVRYRVYRSATEYVAVIAESALMAVKVSGVADPQRIVRDLPSEGVAIHAERMEKGDSGARVSLALEKVVKETQFSMPAPEAHGPHDGFVPLQLRDLDQKRGRSMRILSPQDLDAMMGHGVPPVAEAAEIPPAVEPEPEPQPMAEPEPAQGPATEEELTADQVAALLNGND